MSASKPTLAEQVAALTAQVAALVAAQGAPASAGTAASSTRSADGRDFACTATLAAGQAPCSRRLRSAARAAVHGVDAGGHEYRAQ